MCVCGGREGGSEKNKKRRNRNNVLWDEVKTLPWLTDWCNVLFISTIGGKGKLRKKDNKREPEVRRSDGEETSQKGTAGVMRGSGERCHQMIVSTSKNVWPKQEQKNHALIQILSQFLLGAAGDWMGTLKKKIITITRQIKLLGTRTIFPCEIYLICKIL